MTISTGLTGWVPPGWENYDEEAPRHSLNSLQAHLLWDAVDELSKAAGEDELMGEALMLLVYVLNHHWLNDHNWALTLDSEEAAQ